MPARPQAGTALVTGAGRRIGREIALGLGALGYAVAVHHDRSRDAAAEVAEEIAAAGGRAQVLQANLRDAAAPRALVEAARDALGPVTCLVNNAALFEYDEAHDLDVAVWDAHMELNLRAPMLLSQAFAACLPDGTQGNIVNLIDQRVWKLVPTHFSYTVSKAGLWTVTQMCAQAFAPRIRVNAIGPGPTLPNKYQNDEEFAQETARTLLARGTSPHEVFAAVRFILDMPAMTGQMIALDGGQHLLWQTSDMVGTGAEFPSASAPAGEKGKP